MKCQSEACTSTAHFAFVWPGRDPQPACARCFLWAKHVARALGFELTPFDINIIEAQRAGETVETLQGRSDHG